MKFLHSPFASLLRPNIRLMILFSESTSIHGKIALVRVQYLLFLHFRSMQLTHGDEKPGSRTEKVVLVVAGDTHYQFIAC